MAETPQPNGTVEVFFSYAHEDEELRKRLEQHFSFLKREKKISNWYDGEIRPGREWRGEIDARLDSADIILLLVSAAFADSDFIDSVELRRAMERHEAGEAVVIPIILHPCDWQRAPFAKLQALPGGDEAISQRPNLETALYEVARRVREVVEELIDKRTAHGQPAHEEEQAPVAALGPPPPAIDFVARKDRRGRDMVEHLKRELTESRRRLFVLWGEGGVGKTTVAAEAVRALAPVFGGRIVWASAEKRADFNYSTLLNEIATQLGEPEMTKLAPEPKEQAVRKLIAAAPTLIILDNFETVSLDENKMCADFLATRADCPALITTRERVAHDAARHVHVDSMSGEEAHEFVRRWISQEAHDPHAFDGLDYDEIIRAADARPYVLQWVLAQIDLALEPRAALGELSRIKGEVGERVFQRSFDLPQLGDDGRDTLLALSLFTPSASRPALSEVAGFGDDPDRLNEAVKRLAALRLIQTTPGGQRLTVQGLTRSLAQSRLSADKRDKKFRRRYVEYFLSYAKAHAQPEAAHLDALEEEKDNLLGAMDLAAAMQNWRVLMGIRGGLNRFLNLRGYWDEAVKSGEQAETAARHAGSEWNIAYFTGCVAEIRTKREEYDEARRAYVEAVEIFKKLRGEKNIAACLNGLAMVADRQGDYEEARRRYDEAIGIFKRLGDQTGVAGVLHNLAIIANRQDDLDEARRLYDESLKIAKSLKNEVSIASTLHELGRLVQKQGQLEEARRLYNESLEIDKKLGNLDGIASNLRALGKISEESDKAEAVKLYGEALHIFEKLGLPAAERVRADLARVQGKAAE